MTSHQNIILAHLDRKDDAQASAKEIMRDCGLEHDDVYGALISLEAAGAVEILTEYTDSSKSSGVRSWHLTPVGARKVPLSADVDRCDGVENNDGTFRHDCTGCKRRTDRSTFPLTWWMAVPPLVDGVCQKRIAP